MHFLCLYSSFFGRIAYHLDCQQEKSKIRQIYYTRFDVFLQLYDKRVEHSLAYMLIHINNMNKIYRKSGLYSIDRMNQVYVPLKKEKKITSQIFAYCKDLDSEENFAVAFCCTRYSYQQPLKYDCLQSNVTKTAVYNFNVFYHIIQYGS